MIAQNASAWPVSWLRSATKVMALPLFVVVRLKGVERGGISKTINSNSKSVTDNSRKIDTVNIYPKETLSPGQLQEWQELNP